MNDSVMSREPSRKRVSIITPFFNEEDNAARYCAAINCVIHSIPQVDFEVICIDDGSRDGTLAALLRSIDGNPLFTVVELTRNFGKEAALTAGIDLARGDAVIPMDSDLQDPPEMVADLIREWLKGADVVLAHRADRHSDT